MKKIVLACFCVNETNGGDRLYVETIQEILHQRRETFQVVMCDFYARQPSLSQRNAPSPPQSNALIPQNAAPMAKENISKRQHSLKDLIRPWVPIALREKRADRIDRKLKYANIKAYYEKCLDGASALIVPGGGLVEFSSWRDYYYLLEMLETICRKNRIPLYINSVGYVANEEPKSWVRKWKALLNDPVVRDFSCRDNLAFFKKIKKDARQIPCLACLSADYLKITKEPASNTIGLGMMRPDAYSDYGNAVTKEFLIGYNRELIKALCAKGYQVALFSVGVYRDHRFGKELASYFSTPQVQLLERPDNPKMLLQQIAAMKGILTVRTHSAYAAFSLDIPAVMIYFGKRGWSGKSTEFMKMVGRPANAVCCDAISPAELADLFESAADAGWDQTVRAEAKQLARSNITHILQEIERS